MSSLGGTNHVWASYYMETMGLDDKVTWIGTGNVDTMMGTLKTKQVDVLINSPIDPEGFGGAGLGALLFDGTDEAVWAKYIGGKVPVTSHFTLQATIDKDPPKMQAFVTALGAPPCGSRGTLPKRSTIDRALRRKHVARLRISSNHGV